VTKPKLIISEEIKLLLTNDFRPLLILRISGWFLGAPKPNYFWRARCLCEKLARENQEVASS
jgi:hypothetical protein